MGRMGKLAQCCPANGVKSPSLLLECYLVVLVAWQKEQVRENLGQPVNTRSAGTVILKSNLMTVIQWGVVCPNTAWTNSLPSVEHLQQKITLNTINWFNLPLI